MYECGGGCGRTGPHRTVQTMERVHHEELPVGWSQLSLSPPDGGKIQHWVLCPLCTAAVRANLR